MQEVFLNIYTFTGLSVGRVYLITEGDGLTIIDASLPTAAHKILTQLSAASHAATDVKRIIITHAHPDHVGAIPELQKATGAVLIVPIGERPMIDGEKAIPRAPTSIKPPHTVLKDMKADRSLQDGEVLSEVYGGLQAVSTPGHAPGHMAYWLPEQKVLFCGDVIFNMPRMRLPFRFLTVDMAQNIKSIARLTELEPEVICFGHGKPVTQNATRALHAFAAKVSRS